MNDWTSEAGIYTWGAEPRLYTQLMEPYPAPEFVVTGMRVGCFPYEALMASTLECFYDPICVNSTVQRISRLPSSAWPEPLDKSKPSRFHPNASIQQLFGENMIEQVNVTKNFSSYYESCAPSRCTYSVKKRNNWIYIFTLFLSLCGGLNMGLRMLAPLLVQFGHHIHTKYIKKEQPHVAAQQAQHGIS